MDYSSTETYVRLVQMLSTYDVPAENLTSFEEIQSALMYNFTRTVFRADQQEMYSKPTSWIGMYTAAASLLCVFAMVADLLHGLRNRKLWFPCNYFTINAAFLSVISVTMKLPTDMSNSMPGDVDQVAKLGGMAFLCTMMANLLPSLATMNSKELLTNMIALGVMVITLLVNVCIQIVTGVVTYREDARVATNILPDSKIDLKTLGVDHENRNTIIAIVYMTLLLVLLIIHTCSSLAILQSKKMIDVQYQERHATLSKQSERILRRHDTGVSKEREQSTLVEKLRQHVTKYWIMAGTGSLQFISVRSATTSAAGVICVSSTIIHIETATRTIDNVQKGDYESDYKWSVVFIFAIQSIGVILGTVAPFCRCFAPLCFKVSIKSIRNHIKEVFKVETYWTRKLCDWKKRSIVPFPYCSHSFKVIIEILKIVFLNICIQFQEAVVVGCKIISLVPFFFMICAFYCLKWLKDTGAAVVSSKGRNEESCVESGKRNEDDLKDLRQYVLQRQADETEISGTTLKWLSKSTTRLINKGVRRFRKHEDLLKLIKESRDFEEVKNFEGYHVTSLLKEEYCDCWSLPVVTLTAIALSLPDVDKTEADKLLISVKSGLIYVTHVEESLNTSDDYVSTRKAAETLWLELEVYRQWFGRNSKAELASPNISAEDIVEWFKELAKDMVEKWSGSRDSCEFICANSMYRVTKTIKLSHNLGQKELFKQLSKMISGILAACFTNLPQVILMKCHTCCIEKREASVQAAAKLLGETTEIINTLQERDLPRLDASDLPFFDKWCAAFP